MSLSDWVKNGWLVAHKTSPQEIRDLFGVTKRDLRDCAAKGLSDDWRLAIAYNAALQCATAALAASGYRASREAHHFRIIQSLSFTLNVDSGTVGRPDEVQAQTQRLRDGQSILDTVREQARKMQSALGVRSAESSATLQSLCQHAAESGDRDRHVRIEHRDTDGPRSDWLTLQCIVEYIVDPACRAGVSAQLNPGSA